jgi:hypothetical protein
MNVSAQTMHQRPTYSSSTVRLVEPFVREMSEVFKQLHLLIPKGIGPAQGPSVNTVKWATEVLLRILPREFLIGAQVSAFQREVHVSWENDEKGKRVVVFFPEPGQLKIYYELVENDAVTEHKLVNATSPSAISERLRWFIR